MFVSVFSVELGSSADTCTASVYGAFVEAHTFPVVHTPTVCYDRCHGYGVQKTVESPQLVLPLSVSVEGRLSSGDGFSAVMDYEQFWRLRPCCVELLCVVCPGECGTRFRALKCSGFYSANVV